MITEDEALAEWYGKMYEAYRSMSEDEKEAFREWERQFVTPSNGCGSSDWPGWAEHIGPKPAPAR